MYRDKHKKSNDIKEYEKNEQQLITDINTSKFSIVIQSF